MRRDLATLDRDIGQMIGRPMQEAMAHGIMNDMLYGGLEAGQTALQGLYATQLVKNCLYGSRRVTWDGKVFRYSRAHTTSVVGTSYFVRPGMGSWNGHNPGFLGITGGVVNTRVVGDRTLDIKLDVTSGGTNWFATVDQMVGGQVVLSGMDPIQCRTITAHGVGVSGATITITLDGPLTAMVAATTMCEIIPNQYSRLQAGGSVTTSVMGIPAAPMLALYHGWIQTWGLIWCTPGVVGVGGDANDRTVVFHDDGSIHQCTDHDWGNNKAHQYAGFISHRTVAGDWANPPFIMLQISP